MKTTYSIHADGGRSVTTYGPDLMPHFREPRNRAHYMARYAVDLTRLVVAGSALIIVLALCAAVVLWVASKLLPYAMTLSWVVIAAIGLLGLVLWVWSER